MTTNEPTRARKALCLRLGEEIREYVFKLHRALPDEDVIAAIIDQTLPLSYDESIAEAEAQRKAENMLGPDVPPQGPSRLARLRDALGIQATPGVTLAQVIEAAIERAQECGRLRTMIIDLVHSFDAWDAAEDIEDESLAQSHVCTTIRDMRAAVGLPDNTAEEDDS